jgi:hypothetical protein
MIGKSKPIPKSNATAKEMENPTVSATRNSDRAKEITNQIKELTKELQQLNKATESQKSTTRATSSWLAKGTNMAKAEGLVTAMAGIIAEELSFMPVLSTVASRALLIGGAIAGAAGAVVVAASLIYDAAHNSGQEAAKGKKGGIK